MNVITHLENSAKRMEEECNPEEIKQRFSQLSSVSEADNYLNELVRQRAEINKATIICEKLKAGA